MKLNTPILANFQHLNYFFENERNPDQQQLRLYDSEYTDRETSYIQIKKTDHGKQNNKGYP